jgi:hypothetical protein
MVVAFGILLEAAEFLPKLKEGFLTSTSMKRDPLNVSFIAKVVSTMKLNL